MFFLFYPVQLKGKIAFTANQCIYLLFTYYLSHFFTFCKTIKWFLSLFVSADRDPVREQLLQSPEGQVQRGPVSGTRGDHYRGKMLQIT